MNTTVIVLIILLIVVAAGVAFWYTNQQAKVDEEAAAAAAAVAAAAMVAPAPTPTPVPEPAPEAAPTPADTHPLAGDKFLIVKGEKDGVVKPEDGTVYEGNSRTEDMVITLEPVEGEADIYFLFAKVAEKYIKYNNGGFSLKSKKPTTEKTLMPYKIKFTPIGDDYVMSYMKGDKEMFFGYGDSTMTEDENPGVFTRLINVQEAGVSSFIFTGNFGGDNYVAFPIALDDEEEPKPKTTIDGCFEALPDVDLGEDVSQEDILAVSYSASADQGTRCRAYKNEPGVSASFKKDATAWVTVCADRTKDLNKGCLL
jgi:hypothetical protein